jgi:hypothetical protein
MSAANEAEPMFRVVKGCPTDEELAALVVVLSAVAGSETTETHRSPTGQWAAYWRAVRAPIRPGPGAWRASARG